MKLLCRLKRLYSDHREKRGSRERLNQIFGKIAAEHRREFELRLAILERENEMIKKGNKYVRKNRKKE